MRVRVGQHKTARCSAESRWRTRHHAHRLRLLQQPLRPQRARLRVAVAMRGHQVPTRPCSHVAHLAPPRLRALAVALARRLARLRQRVPLRVPRLLLLCGGLQRVYARGFARGGVARNKREHCNEVGLGGRVLVQREADVHGRRARVHHLST